MSALFTSVHRSDYAALRKALKQGADINSTDADGRTPLMHAILADQASVEMVRFLISSGAAIDARDNGHAWTALHFAARDQKTAMVQALLDAGSAVDPLDSFGNTPLWRAVMNGGRLSVIEALLQSGADPHKENDAGLSPLGLAGWLGKADLVELLNSPTAP